MAEIENALNDDLMLGATRLGHRLWRNNRGIAYQRDGSVVKYGVGPNGASDLLGFCRVIVTPEMIGRPLAVFAAVEAKTGRQRPREDQERFLEFIRRQGGVATWGTDEERILAELQPGQLEMILEGGS